MEIRPLLSVLSLLALGVACTSGTSSSSGASGGSASGGSASGGAGGTGTAGTGTAGTASGGTSSGGTAGAGPACATDAECKLHNDCCSCDAVLASDEPPSCNKACDVGACAAQGAAAARCIQGVCRPAYQCSDEGSNIGCTMPKPSCPSGELPVQGVWEDDANKNCWTGKCAPVTQCLKVPDCKVCPEGTFCSSTSVVGGAAGGGNPTPSLSCRDVPAECGGTVTCDCAGTCEGGSGDCRVSGNTVICTYYAP